MGLGLDGGLYRLLLLLHILTATAGFGAVIFNGIYRARARQRGGDAELVVLEENGYVTRMAEYLIYAVFILGILVALTSKKSGSPADAYWQFSDTWLSLAMLLYLIEIGLLHGFIHRAEREYKFAGPGQHCRGQGQRRGGPARAAGEEDQPRLGRLRRDLSAHPVPDGVHSRSCPGGLSPVVHPIEHLRYVTRASGADPTLLVRETAEALAGVMRVEPAGLVPACRRLVERHLTVGPVWWMATRVLTAPDPVVACRRAAAAMEGDKTAAALSAALPDDVTVTVVGWPDLTGLALRRRGDLEVLVTDALGEGGVLARRLDEAGTRAVVVADAGVAAAVVVSDVVVIEATAAGPSGILATLGSHSAAAVAAQRAVPTFAVAGEGRVLPGPLWDELLRRLDQGPAEPWDRAVELVPATLLSEVIGPTGPARPADGLATATCPVAPELLRRALG